MGDRNNEYRKYRYYRILVNGGAFAKDGVSFEHAYREDAYAHFGQLLEECGPNDDIQLLGYWYVDGTETPLLRACGTVYPLYVHTY